MRAQFIRAVPAAVIVALIAAPCASAGDRCRFAWATGAAETTFPQQLALDAGDIPGHRIRIFEIHHGPNSANEPNCEGLKIGDIWARGFGDSIDRNGRSWGYAVYTFDNGDKIHAEWSGVSMVAFGADGSVKTTYQGTATWVGGTGRYQGVRGIEQDHALTEMAMGSQGKLESKTNEATSEAEYWFEK